MKKRFACLCLCGLMASLLAGCGPKDDGALIPIEITNAVPAAGSTITDGTQFTLTIAYQVPSLAAGEQAVVSANFRSTSNTWVGGSSPQVLDDLSGTVELKFTFSTSSFLNLKYPYELQAFLSKDLGGGVYQNIADSALLKYN